MLDKPIAIISVAALVAFTAVVVVFVKELDLAIVVILCLLMAGYDFWTTLREQRTGVTNAAIDAVPLERFRFDRNRSGIPSLAAADPRVRACAGSA